MKINYIGPSDKPTAIANADAKSWKRNKIKDTRNKFEKPEALDSIERH